MDRFRELSTFVAVAEAGAFNEAARRLHLSPPVVTRLVTALEGRLGVPLLTRTTRRVALTEAGRHLLQDARRILADLQEAEAVAAGERVVPRGLLSLTAPVLFGQRFIMPILRDYLDAHPDLRASTLFVDRVVNLLEEGLDIAVRIGPLDDSGLFATRVGTVRRVVVAAPAYLERAVPLARTEDLPAHRIILSTAAIDADGWSFSLGGTVRRVRLAPALRVNSNSAAIDAAVAGWGVTRLLSYQVADALADGRLVEVLAAEDDERLPIHLLQAEGRKASAKIRGFIELAALRLRAEAQRLAAV